MCHHVAEEQDGVNPFKVMLIMRMEPSGSQHLPLGPKSHYCVWGVKFPTHDSGPRGQPLAVEQDGFDH